MQLQSLGQDDPLEKQMTTHSSIFAWEIPWAEEPGGLQSEVAKSWTWLKRLSTHTAFMEKRTCGNSYTVSMLGLWDWALNPSNRAAWLTLPAVQPLWVRVSMLADREEKSPFYPFDRPLINSNHENWSCAQPWLFTIVVLAIPGLCKQSTPYSAVKWKIMASLQP